MVDGHFSLHLRRTRTLYAERQALLVEAATSELSGLLAVRSSATGMHLVGHLPPAVADAAAARAAWRRGVEAPAVSTYRIEPGPAGGLMLGYAAVDSAAIREGVRSSRSR